MPLTSAVAVNREWNSIIVTEPRFYSLVLCFRCSPSDLYSSSVKALLPSLEEYANWLERSAGCDIQVDILFNTYMFGFGVIRDLVVPHIRQLSAFYFQFENAWAHHKELVEILSSVESFPRLRSLCFRWIPDDRSRESATVFNLTSITLDAPVLQNLSLANSVLNWRGSSKYSPLSCLSQLRIDMSVNDTSESLTWSSLLNVLRSSPRLSHLDLKLDRIHGPYESASPKVHLSQLRFCTLGAQIHDLLGLLSRLVFPPLKEVTLEQLPNSIGLQPPVELEILNPDLSMILHLELTGFNATCIGQLISRSKADSLQLITHTLTNSSLEETVVVPPPDSFPIVGSSLPNLKINMRDSYYRDKEHRSHAVKQIYDTLMTFPNLLSLTVLLPCTLNYASGMYDGSAARSILADRRHKLLTLQSLSFHGCLGAEENFPVTDILSILEAPQLCALSFDGTDYTDSFPPVVNNLFCAVKYPLVQIQNLSIKNNYAATVLSGVPATFPNLRELHVHHIDDQPDWRWDSILPQSHVTPLPLLEVITVIPMNEVDGESFYKLWIDSGHPLKKLGVGSLEVIERWWTSQESARSV